MKADEKVDDPGGSFLRLKKAMKAILLVPKAEIERRDKEWHRRKAKPPKP